MLLQGNIILLWFVEPSGSQYELADAADDEDDADEELKELKQKKKRRRRRKGKLKPDQEESSNQMLIEDEVLFHIHFSRAKTALFDVITGAD